MNKIIKLLLSLMMCVSMFVGTPIFALDDIEETKDEYNISLTSIDEQDDIPVFNTIEAAGEYLREGVVNRTFEKYSDTEHRTSILLPLSASDDANVLHNTLRELMYKHTTNPSGGDYFENNMNYAFANVSQRDDYWRVDVTVYYDLTYSQHLEMEAAVKELLDTLDVYEASDYEKVRAIFDWICLNVQYDYTLNNYSAYDALINKSVVCQGYGTLFYRLCMELGIDARYCGGITINSWGFIESHGWNIVRVENQYYYVDPTWGAGLVEGKPDYYYFLKGIKGMNDHVIVPSRWESEIGDYCVVAEKDYHIPEMDQYFAIGKCNENIDFKISKNGILTFSGTGLLDVSMENWQWPNGWGQGWIKEVVFEEGITGVTDGVLSFMYIANVTFPSTFEYIGNFCFDGYVGHVVEIPKTITHIGQCTFNSRALQEYIVDPNNPVYTSYNNCLFSKDMKTMYAYAGIIDENSNDITEFVIPNGVVTIGKYAFRNYSREINVVLPDSVKYIEEGAFYCLTKGVVNLTDNIVRIEDYGFYGNNQMKTIYIGRSVNYIGEGAFTGVRTRYINVHEENPKFISVNDVLFTKDMKRLIRYACNKEDTQYDIPEGVIEIGQYAFVGAEGQDCGEYVRSANLKVVNFPSTLKKIGEYAFHNQLNLIQLNFSEGLEEIGFRAFLMGDSIGTLGKMESIIIPDSVKYIGGEAFYQQTIETIVIGSGVEAIGCNAFAIGAFPAANDNREINVFFKGKPPVLDECSSCIFNIIFGYDIGEIRTDMKFANVYYLEENAEYWAPNQEKQWYPNEEFKDWHIYPLSSFVININEDNKEVIVPKYNCVNGKQEYVLNEDGTIEIHNLTEGKEHVGEWNVIEVTCTADGYKTRECEVCGTIEKLTIHTQGHSCVVVTIVEPTCDSEGYTKKSCLCGSSYFFTDQKEALGHDMGECVLIKEASCTEVGEERSQCSRCSKFESRYIKAVGHQKTSIVTLPTCTEQGYTTYTCECGNSYVSDYVGIIPHDYEVTNINPTCTTDGITTHQCKNCSYSYEDHFERWGHLFTNYVSDNNATTEQDGTKTAKCERCDETDTIIDEGSKLPNPEHKHSYAIKVTEPTCTEQGYKTYTCECGDSYVADYVGIIPHDYEVTNINPTCTTEGITTHQCKNCSYSYEDHFERWGHLFTNYVSNNDATTEQNGTKTAKCERCDETDTIVDEGSKLPKPEHKHEYTQEVTAPTCTEGGYTTYTCECGDSYIGNYVNTLGHDMGNWMMISMPTCTKDGLERCNCTRCNYYEERNIQAEHGYTAKVIAPTCTEQGYTIWTCHCGDTYKDNYTNALHHEFKTYLSNNDATTEQDGTKTAKCERCNETNTITDVGSKLPSQEEPKPEQPQEPSKPVVNGANRVFGASRYETAFKVANTLKSTLGVDKFDAVIVANGTNFADALAGSYLSAKKNAPILMTDKKNANITSLVNYIKSNLRDGGVVYILGGSAAVSSDLDKQLYSNYYVKRLAGNDRYGTNLEILKEAGVTTEDLLVCTGTNFADSLSASATGRPMLLVGKKLNQDQIHFLNSLNGNKIYVVGGTGAVNGTIEASLRAYGEVSRLAGASRYKTSVMVAETFFSNPTSAVVAYGRNFPDGLSGGALAYTLQAPLLLAENKEASVIAEYTNRNGIRDGYVLGGSGLISEDSKQIILNK